MCTAGAAPRGRARRAQTPRATRRAQLARRPPAPRRAARAASAAAPRRPAARRPRPAGRPRRAAAGRARRAARPTASPPGTRRPGEAAGAARAQGRQPMLGARRAAGAGGALRRPRPGRQRAHARSRARVRPPASAAPPQAAWQRRLRCYPKSNDERIATHIAWPGTARWWRRAQQASTSVCTRDGPTSYVSCRFQRRRPCWRTQTGSLVLRLPVQLALWCSCLFPCLPPALTHRRSTCALMLAWFHPKVVPFTCSQAQIKSNKPVAGPEQASLLDDGDDDSAHPPVASSTISHSSRCGLPIDLPPSWGI